MRIDGDLITPMEALFEKADEKLGGADSDSGGRCLHSGGDPPYNRDDREYHERYARAKRMGRERRRRQQRERIATILSKMPVVRRFVPGDVRGSDGGESP